VVINHIGGGWFVDAKWEFLTFEGAADSGDKEDEEEAMEDPLGRLLGLGSVNRGSLITSPS
jgi:hypothetical protein